MARVIYVPWILVSLASMNYLWSVSVELSGDHGLSQNDSDEDHPSCSDSLSDIESNEVCQSYNVIIYLCMVILDYNT